jgi:outer membrane immunogenic protein
MRKRIQEAAMRRLLVVLGLIASISSAFAQEYETPVLQQEIPSLRGSDSFVPDAPGPLYRPRWSGFYAGGQVGYGAASVDFSGATRDLIGHMLRNTQLQNEQVPSEWTVLGKTSTGAGSFGGFLGYNIGWEGVILGVELNYNHTNFSTSAPVFPIGRVVAVGSNVDHVQLIGSASMRITDYGTLRARAGYEVGNFLPFAMIGLAFGRADVTRAAAASVLECPIPAQGAPPPPCNGPFLFSESEAKNGAFIYGWALGGGLEVMVMPKVFVRAEYEYVAFSPIWNIKAQIQTARAGLGFKF